MKRINITDLSFSYETPVNIFLEVSTEISLNEVTFLKGSNGSGKTTFCRIISGLEKEYFGSVQISDLDVQKASFEDLAKHVVYLKQEPQTNVVAATADADLRLWYYHLNKEKKSAKNLRQKVMRRLKIDELKDEPVWELSGGQIKRIGLAGLLLNYDKYWILDEPLSGLDNSLANIVIQILEERKCLGKGCLIISHKEDLFSNLIDNKLFIENKKIIQQLKK